VNYTYYSLYNYNGTALQANHLEDLVQILQPHFDGGNIMIIPHFGGRPANPSWGNNDMIRLIEIYSDHFRSEERLYEFYKNNWHYGYMASSDSHSGNPGYSMTFPKNYKIQDTPWEEQEIGTSLVAVYAEELTRESVFDNLFARHCYATTGDRIILSFKVNGHLMGSEISAGRKVNIDIEAMGTETIQEVQLIRNMEVIRSFDPGTNDFSITLQDEPDYSTGKSVYYTRVVQENDEIAVSSPVWVTPVK
jgi:hypothetical protein